MSESINLPQAPAKGKTEFKVKAMSYAAFALSTVALTWLGTTATDYVHGLADWLEVPAYSLLGTLALWLTGYQTKNKPEALSPSTVAAVKTWLSSRMTGRS